MASVSLNLSIWEKSYSIENNTSEIGWSLSVTSSNAYNGYDNQCPYVVKYNNSSGSIVASGNKGFNNNTTTQLASGTISGYKHNTDGSASITLYAHYTTGVSPATASVSTTIKLTTIPRASSVSVANYNLGQNISAVIGKKSSSFTSTLTYKIGSRTGTIVSKTSSSTYVWEMSSELISQIKQDNPTNKSISAIIYCETYSGSTKIGSTQSASFTLTITDKPTITNISISEGVYTVKEYTTSIIKYISMINFTIEATATEGTIISNYQIKCGDITKNNTENYLLMDNIQYSYLNEEGIRKTKFIAICTDARGNSSEEYSLEVDFIEYVKLAFNNTDITFNRLNGTSNFIKLHMTGYVYNGLIGETQNTLIIQYRYKKKNDSEAVWSELKTIDAVLNDDNTFVIDNLQLEEEFDYRENYDIEFYADDVFITATYSSVIKTSETIAKWHKNGLDCKNITIEKQQVIYRGIEEQYSEEEQKIGIWIDGKPIYRKTIVFPNGTGGVITNTNYKLTEFNITNVEEIYISTPSFYTLNGFAYPFPYYDGNKFAIYASTTELHIHLQYEQIANSKFVVTLEYTKTTDILEEENNDI